MLISGRNKFIEARIFEYVTAKLDGSGAGKSGAKGRAYTT